MSELAVSLLNGVRKVYLRNHLSCSFLWHANNIWNLKVNMDKNSIYPFPFQFQLLIRFRKITSNLVLFESYINNKLDVSLRCSLNELRLIKPDELALRLADNYLLENPINYET